MNIKEIKHYQSKNGLNKIKLYLTDIINNFKRFDTWKFQLTIAVSLAFSKNNDEEHAIC